VDAFAKEDILEVLLVAILLGFAMSAARTRTKPLLDLIESLTQSICHCEHHHAIHADRRIWSDGVHCGKYDTDSGIPTLKRANAVRKAAMNRRRSGGTRGGYWASENARGSKTVWIELIFPSFT
jgi:hypothetical protein